MTIAKLKRVRDLCRELDERMATLDKARRDSRYTQNGHEFKGMCPRESGAVRRCSMELTRALAELRRS